MAINLSQISWHQKDNEISTYFNVGANSYIITFSRSPDNFNSNIKKLFNSQANIVIPDDAWKIVVQMLDDNAKQVEWTISKSGGIEEFITIVEVTQHFETLLNPSTMIFVCPNTMIENISDLFTTAVRAMWDVTVVNGKDNSYFYFSKKDTTGT